MVSPGRDRCGARATDWPGASPEEVVSLRRLPLSARLSFPVGQRTPVQEDLWRAPSQDHGHVLPDAGLPHIRELAFLRAYDYPQALLGPGIQEEPIVEAGGRAALKSGQLREDPVLQP